MEKLLPFQFGAPSQDRYVWRPIGEKAQIDLTRITYSSTPYATAEDSINHAMMRGGLAYRKNGELHDFPPNVVVDLKDMLILSNRWFLMFGMVAMFSAPHRPPFFCVIPDTRSGYFVARYTREKTVEVGWRFHDQDAMGEPSDEKRPDSRVKVFIWPGHQPDPLEGQPFRSRLAVLLRPHAMIEEFRDNTLDGEYLGTHPPMITTLKMDGLTLGGSNIASAGIDVDTTRTATMAARQGRTERAQHELQQVKNHHQQEVAYDETTGQTYDTRRRRIGYMPDGRRSVVVRGDLWSNRIPLRPGMQVERTPQPMQTQPWVERERFFSETIYRALGVPMRSGSGANRARQGGSAETSMTADDMVQMRTTVMGARNNMIDAFTFMYMHFMSEASVAKAEQHRKDVMGSIDQTINSLSEYLNYLVETDQLDTEPMYAQKEHLAKKEAADERRKIIAERTSRIVQEALRKGKYVDQQVVMRHLTDIYDLKEQRDETDRVLEKDVKGMLNIRLEFRHPPTVDTNNLLQLARDGLFNPKEAMRLYAVSTGISEEGVEAALEGVDFIPLQRAAELKVQQEQQKAQLALEKQRLELEKLKEENKVRLENKKIQAAQQKQQEGAGPGSSSSTGGSANGSGEKRKASKETGGTTKKKK